MLTMINLKEKKITSKLKSTHQK